MYQIASSIVGKENMCEMGDCIYRFYRGREWLYFQDDKLQYFYKMVIAGAHMTLDINLYDTTSKQVYASMNSIGYAISRKKRRLFKFYEREKSLAPEVIEV